MNRFKRIGPYVVMAVVLTAVSLSVLHELRRIKPQLREEIIANQTVKLDGEVYVCGTIGTNNRDRESLYCRGFADGFSWGRRMLELGD